MLSLERQQWIPRTIEELWPLFETPSSRAKLVPPFFKLEIISPRDEPLFEDQEIEYLIEFLPNKKRPCIVEISECIPRLSFIEEHRSGPYRFWHHRHNFESKDNGVWMIDRIHFQIRSRIFGMLIYNMRIRKRLIEQFDFQEKYMRKHFEAGPARKTGSL